MAVSTDRFRMLPDSLLLLILSLLPFKEVIRTCVLSKRWRDTVKSSFNNIQLNEEFFVQPNERDEETKEAQRSAFLNFATSWMDKYKEPVVNRFSLKLSMPGNASEFIRRCISFVNERKFKESLELDFSNPNWDDEDMSEEHLTSFELPSLVYEQNGGLEYLKLYSCGLSEANVLHHFKALKEVSLGWMEVTTYMLRTLLSNCVMLEILSLKRCKSQDVFDLEEDGKRLRKLVIEKCRFHIDLVRLNIPLLSVFRYFGMMSYFLIEADLPLLEEVEIDLSLEYGFDGHGPLLYDLVEGLYSVRVLTVCSYLLRYVPTGGQPMRTERDLNVRHLILKTALREDEYFGIAFMLNSCPMLERLTIELRSTYFLMNYMPPIDVSHDVFWRDNVSAYRCLMSTLKEVEVKGFKGSMSEVVVLTHLIAYGRVLKKMCVHVLKEDDDGEDGVDWESYRTRVAEVLLIVRKASSDLEIIIT